MYSTWYIKELVELLFFKTASHILHFASLPVFSSKHYAQDFIMSATCLCFLFFFSLCRHGCLNCLEPFGVGVAGMVASSSPVQAGETLNHYIASKENSPTIEHRLQLTESRLI